MLLYFTLTIEQSTYRKMEKKINKMAQEYQLDFKNNIKKWLEEKDTKKTINEETKSELLKYIFDYNTFEITKEDLQKRKRVKNIIPPSEKCIAKRSNEHQCTRRWKTQEEMLCGTHLKGTPYGVFAETNTITAPDGTTSINGAAASAAISSKSALALKTEIWIQEIKGIHYYIDNVNNVYNTEDIVANKTNPEIIAKWKLNANDKYTIPEFGI